MKKSVNILFLLTLMLLCRTALADAKKELHPSALPHSSISETAKNKENEIMSKSENEAELYKKLYEASIKNNDRIISTIQWSIGLVATFIVVLLGSQIFFNYRVSKEEIRSIRSDLEERSTKIKSDLLETINQDGKDITVSIRNSFENYKKESNENINTRVAEKEKYLDSKIESLNNYNKLEINELSINLKNLEGHVWQLRGVNANALRDFISTANLQIDNKYEPKYVLKDIIKTLKEMDRINQTDWDSLEKLMPKIPPNSAQLKDEIESLYKSLRQYTFIEDPENPNQLKLVYV